MGERVDAYLTSPSAKASPNRSIPWAATSAAKCSSPPRGGEGQSDRRFYIAAIGGIVAFFVALGFAIEGAGTRDFVITLAIGAAVIYGVNTVLYRNLKSKLAARGIDLERIATQ